MGELRVAISIGVWVKIIDRKEKGNARLFNRIP
jgi:hypothetical protein